MTTAALRMTRPTIDVLRLLLAEPEGDPLWGAKISELTDLGKSTVSQILARLTALGWVTLRREEEPHPGRPPRVFHSMSPQGRRRAKTALAARQARGPCRTPAPVMSQKPPAPAPRPVSPAADNAAGYKPSERAARHASGQQRTAGEPRTSPAQPMPKLAGYWPIRWPSPDALRRLTAAPSPNALTEDACMGADEPPHDTADIAHHLAPLTDALATLDAVNQSLTKDVFARAAAGATHTEQYEKLIRAIVMKSNDLRRTTMRAPRTRSARPNGD
ncbi:MarR family transcriptional regulator [Streptomyces sp. NPDC005438]|uniref:MarR family transcriptional regulator n=1 Tax=Streptomyces sp. NPDC005438 TaxID=3156880 RepID=UPI0033B47F8A